ncbi:hypothetical protein ETG59_17760 [Proteus mirabilis]|nr:hypothetical protein [Proteus mirabilis]MBN7155773.1 hypothetical protein [Proteus mirabilis]MBN7168536.1 hypothetical protein [Proteus mirabilis]MBN7187817.1 hypothetical protein [Proteus mirabilis]MBN7201051.1 hypothetical protein [Proteus mirabilis]
MYYTHSSLSGLPEALTNSEGEIVWQGQYSAWGHLQRQTRPTSTFNREQNLRFQGQYFDKETGLHYNTFRYYAPDLGRFTQQDPIGLAGGINLYAYAPNPLTWVDPWGLSNCGISRGNNPYQTRIDPTIPGRPDPKYSIDSHTFTSGDITSKGGIRNTQQFWEQWSQLRPESLSASNKYLIDNYSRLKVSPRIDDTWIKVFPEHINYKGDVLIHHHVDFSQYVIPVPGKTHVGSGGVWHTK